MKFWLIFYTMICANIFSLFASSYPLSDGWQVATSHEVRQFATIVNNPESENWQTADLAHPAFRTKINRYYLLRIKIRPTESFTNPALFIPRNVYSINIWQKGQKIYSFSDHNQFQPAKFLGWIWHIIPLKKSGQENYLYLQIYSGMKLNFPQPIVGEKEQLIRDIFIENISGLFVVVISLFLAIIFWSVYLYKKEKLYLAITILYFFVGWWLLNINPLMQYILPLTPLRLQSEYLSLYLAPIGALMVLENIIQSRINKIFRVVRYLTFSYFLLFGLLDFLRLFPLWKTLIPFDIVLLVIIILFVFQIFKSAYRGNVQAKILAVGLLFLIIFAVHDILVVIGVWPDAGMLMHIGTFGFFLSMNGAAIYRVFEMNRNLQKYSLELEINNRALDDLNQNLEKKVNERTKELSDSIQKIQNLKVQQDGDYYLTSLIEKPLATNFNKSDNVQVDFYTAQKKKFEFRKRRAELGGDISICGNLRFQKQSHRFIFFFNGDAMGKSMQGAGGAIVAGTALNNIIARSAREDRVIDKTPLEWLRNTYLELDGIFRTFEGAMLMSAVAGIIDERSGEMWSFNAEHPSTVLYRDNKAEFIDPNTDLRKLGSPLNVEFQSFYTRLQPGDILICGSDGRDDLDISKEGSFMRTINDDETLFLSAVEKAEADIDRIVANLQDIGEITDDLSLVKIQFH